MDQFETRGFLRQRRCRGLHVDERRAQDTRSRQEERIVTLATMHVAASADDKWYVHC